MDAVRLTQRLRACGRLPEGPLGEPELAPREAVLAAWLGDYEGAIRSCTTAGDELELREALEALVAALPRAEAKSCTFFPRKSPRRPSTTLPDGATVMHGTFLADDGTDLGFVLLSPPAGQAGAGGPPAILVRWGGNAELAAEEPRRPFASLVGRGLAFCVFADYRSYGWSGGVPSVATLRSDAAALFRALPTLLGERGLQWPPAGPVVLMGRSIGRAC